MGLVGGVVGLVFIGIIAMYTMQLQIAVKCAIKKTIRNYSDMGVETLSPRGQTFLNFCLISSQIGFAIAYLIFIGNQVDQVICFETMYEECNMKNYYIALAAFLLVPICWLRSLKNLAYVTMAANIFLVAARKYLSLGCADHAPSSVCDHVVLLQKPSRPPRAFRKPQLS